MNYLWHMLIFISLYSLLSMSLNLVVGYAGLLSLCHAAFYGLGAYSTALLMTRSGWGFFPALLAAMVITALLSSIIAVPSLRLRGDFFVLATLGFQVIVFSLLYNWDNFTNGSYGITGIANPVLFGWSVDTPFRYFLLAGTISVVGLGLMRALALSPFGRVLKAIRENEVAAVALGKNVALLKIVVFAVAAAFAAVSGGIFAAYTQYIDPTSFMLSEALFILSIVIIGGAGNQVGPLIGTVLLVTLPEMLRFLRMPDAIASSLRQVIYGAAIVLLMRFRPQGIQGDYKFD